jgi:hypothetical protein
LLKLLLRCCYTVVTLLLHCCYVGGSTVVMMVEVMRGKAQSLTSINTPFILPCSGMIV